MNLHFWLQILEIQQQNALALEWLYRSHYRMFFILGLFLIFGLTVFVRKVLAATTDQMAMRIFFGLPFMSVWLLIHGILLSPALLQVI